MEARRRTIGQVVSVLQAEFPELTVSKIRFLETERLITPERAQSGYRKYSDQDVERLTYVLRMQRDYYLPLDVIRKNLDMLDRGLQPPEFKNPHPVVPMDVALEPSASNNQTGKSAAPRIDPKAKGPVRLSRAELIEASKISESVFIELERQMLVTPKRGTNYYDKEALTVAIAAHKLAVFGIDARHLAAIKRTADSEVAMVDRAMAPHLRQSSTTKESVSEVCELVMRAHAALMRMAVDRGAK